VKSRDRDEMDWSDPGPLLLARNATWPKVATRPGSDAFDAGPTGLPWIDSNGWFIQLARARLPGKPIWILAAPPPPPAIVRPSGYAVAVADAAVYGARWVASLDPAVSKGVVTGNGEARKAWDALVRALGFQLPITLPPCCFLAALSDFSTANQNLTYEFLNLIAREYVPVHVLPKDAAPSIPSGLRMIAYLDPDPVREPWKTALLNFARNGGAVLTSPGALPTAGAPTTSPDLPDYEQRAQGKGRIICSRAPFDDAWRLALDAHLLLGRRNDLVRVANAGSCSLTLASSPDARRAELRIINYAGRPGLNPVTVTLLHPYRAARFRTLERPDPVELPVHREYGRAAVYLPHFATYSELSLEL
jgi:hypothetical protein